MSELDLITPGEILLEEFMKPNDISQAQMAKDLNIPVSRIRGVVHGRSHITADLALRLARYFGTTAELWLSLQNEYDVRKTQRAIGKDIKRQVQPLVKHFTNNLTESHR